MHRLMNSVHEVSPNHGPFTVPPRRCAAAFDILSGLCAHSFAPFFYLLDPAYLTQLANWLEFYADSLELNVWTSTTATHAARDDKTGKWAVTVKKADGSERIFNVDHVVFAIGLGAGVPKMLNIPGQVSASLSPSPEQMHGHSGCLCDSTAASGGIPGTGAALHSPPYCERPSGQEGRHHWRLHLWFVEFPCSIYYGSDFPRSS